MVDLGSYIFVRVIVTIAYGSLTIAGGVMGYAKAKSKVSLISGGISGGLLVVMGILMTLAKSFAIGFWGAIAIALFLVVTFTVRLIKTQKFMPAGLMVLAGMATLLILWFG